MYNKKKALEKKEKGLCIYLHCNQLVLPGKIMCVEHRSKKNQRQKKIRMLHKEKDLCMYCNQPVEKGKTCCTLHLIKKSKYGKKYYQKNKAFVVQQQKKRIQFLKDQNCCQHCGQPLLIEDCNYTTCLNCREGIQQPLKRRYAL